MNLASVAARCHLAGRCQPHRRRRARLDLPHLPETSKTTLTPNPDRQGSIARRVTRFSELARFLSGFSTDVYTPTVTVSHSRDQSGGGVRKVGIYAVSNMRQRETSVFGLFLFLLLNLAHLNLLRCCYTRWYRVCAQSAIAARVRTVGALAGPTFTVRTRCAAHREVSH